MLCKTDFILTSAYYSTFVEQKTSLVFRACFHILCALNIFRSRHSHMHLGVSLPSLHFSLLKISNKGKHQGYSNLPIQHLTIDFSYLTFAEEIQWHIRKKKSQNRAESFFKKPTTVAKLSLIIPSVDDSEGKQACSYSPGRNVNCFNPFRQQFSNAIKFLNAYKIWPRKSTASNLHKYSKIPGCLLQSWRC